MNFKKVFNSPLTLFLFPLLIFLFSFIAARLSHDWTALAYAVWVIISLLALLITLLFFLLNHFFFRCSLSWWKNILLSLGLFILAVLILVLLLRTERTPIERPTNPEAKFQFCTSDKNCSLPMDYAIQSNCPYGTACINQRCSVICPLTFHDPNMSMNISRSYACEKDNDCDCTTRGDRTLHCTCLNHNCVSVEAHIQNKHS